MWKPRVSLIISTYKSDDYIEGFFSDIQKQTRYKDIQLLICANDPSEKEISAINKFKGQNQDGKVKTIKVERESLYASWNRCIRMADAPLVAIGNIDDLRLYDSLEKQVRILENDDFLFCYGAFETVDSFGEKSGSLVSSADTKHDLTRGMYLGPFFVWNKSIFDEYFDDQFKSGGDFDFAIRLALSGKGYYFREPLGYYLNEQKGLSTGSALQPIERTVIELRYGIYDKIDYQYLPQALEYDIYNLSLNGEKKHISELVPGYDTFLKNRYEKWFLAGLKNYYKRQKSGRVRSVIEKYISTSILRIIKKVKR